MSIHFSTFAVHKETTYNKLSALPKHGNRYTMLQLNYSFNDPADIQTALYKINDFLENYTNRPYRTESFNDHAMVFVYDFSCAYEAMQLIDAIDVILDTLGFGFMVDFIHYSEETQK